MTTCADVVASTLRAAGVEVVFGLPGGEILDFMEAARRAGIRFLSAGPASASPRSVPAPST